MYSLIIVDDENAIRKGMSQYVDWKAMDFEVIASFAYAKEAMSFIHQNKVDVVLTDIEMSDLSGLDLAKYICENQLPCKVVIISGYQKFEYARRAVEYSVENYLLKPIHMEDIAAVFAKIKRELDIKKQDQARLVNQQQAFYELLPDLRDQFWLHLLLGGFDSSKTLAQRMSALYMEIPTDTPCGVVCLKRHDTTYAWNMSGQYQCVIKSILDGNDEKTHSVPVFLGAGELKVVLVSKLDESCEAFHKRIWALIAQKSQTALQIFKINFVVAIEKIFAHIFDLSDYYCKLAQRGECADLSGAKQIASSVLSMQEYANLTQKFRLLMGAVNEGNLDLLDELLDSVFVEFSKLPLFWAKQVAINLYSALWADFTNLHFAKEANINRILLSSDFEQFKCYCHEILLDLVTRMSGRKAAGSNNIVAQAIAYINEHFSEDISLEMIADQCYLNAAYFSRMFKQHQGVTFTEYLIGLRMDKAKALLLQKKYKVYEVSKMVGYRSEKYFFRIFKQYTGFSPAEYYRSCAK